MTTKRAIQLPDEFAGGYVGMVMAILVMLLLLTFGILLTASAYLSLTNNTVKHYSGELTLPINEALDYQELITSIPPQAINVMWSGSSWQFLSATSNTITFRYNFYTEKEFPLITWTIDRGEVFIIIPALMALGFFCLVFWLLFIQQIEEK